MNNFKIFSLLSICTVLAFGVYSSSIDVNSNNSNSAITLDHVFTQAYAQSENSGNDEDEDAWYEAWGKAITDFFSSSGDTTQVVWNSHFDFSFSVTENGDTTTYSGSINSSDTITINGLPGTIPIPGKK